MPTYLADLVAKVRIDLHDEDNTAYRWATTTLQRHIARALREYSAVSPYTAQLTMNATDGVRDYALTAQAAITGRPDAVVAVECPYVAASPHYPPRLVKYRIFANTLSLLVDEPPATGDVIRIWYTTEHTLSDSTRTYPADDEDLLALGAAAYAALERESYSTERITIDDQTQLEYQRWGERSMRQWQYELKARRQNTAQRTDTHTHWDTSGI
jgi:hypothetical protein